MLPYFYRIAVLFLVATPAWAQDNSAAQCSSIADPAARLACYDAAQPPHSAATPPARPGPAPSHYPEFGNVPRAQAPEPPSSGAPASARSGKLVAVVVSYSLAPSGRFTIVLDNGQVWKQVESDDGVAQFRKQGRNIVTISKGFLWSYDLKLNAMSAVFKVTRVK